METFSVNYFPAFGLSQILAIMPTAVSTVLILLAIALFIISFMVAGSEVAFFSLTYKDINMLKTQPQPSFRRIILLLEQPKILLASMLIANSLANIGIILISNFLLETWLLPFEFSGFVRFALKALTVTFFLVLFGEVLPKVWATNDKVRFASTSSLLIELLNSIFFRLSKRLVRLSDGIEQKFSTGNQTQIDNSQLDYAIDLLPDHEATIEEKQILKGIRKFSDTTVKQVMRTRLDVCGIEYDTSFTALVQKVEELHYSRLPVFKKNLDEIAGMLHTKDLLPFIGIEVPENFDWHTLIRNSYFVHEQKLIEDLLQEFRNKRIHFAVVVDEFGGTSGIVTLEDIMEEIIGEIRDEFDEDERLEQKIDDFTYILEGKMMINDVCKLMKIPVDTFDTIRGDSDSLAGLVLEIAGKFPLQNEAVNWNRYTFLPLVVNKNRIDQIKVLISPEN